MTPTRPPCFQCPIFSSYERSSTPRRSSAMAVSDFLISLTKLGHGPLSSSSNSGVSLFFLSSLMAAPFGAWISNRNPDNAIKLIQGLSGGTPECGPAEILAAQDQTTRDRVLPRSSTRPLAVQPLCQRALCYRRRFKAFSCSHL